MWLRSCLQSKSPVSSSLQEMSSQPVERDTFTPSPNPDDAQHGTTASESSTPSTPTKSTTLSQESASEATQVATRVDDVEPEFSLGDGLVFPRALQFNKRPRAPEFGPPFRSKIVITYHKGNEVKSIIFLDSRQESPDKMVRSTYPPNKLNNRLRVSAVMAILSGEVFDLQGNLIHPDENGEICKLILGDLELGSALRCTNKLYPSGDHARYVRDGRLKLVDFYSKKMTQGASSTMGSSAISTTSRLQLTLHPDGTTIPPALKRPRLMSNTLAPLSFRPINLSSHSARNLHDELSSPIPPATLPEASPFPSPDINSPLTSVEDSPSHPPPIDMQIKSEPTNPWDALVKLHQTQADQNLRRWRSVWEEKIWEMEREHKNTWMKTKKHLEEEVELLSSRVTELEEQATQDERELLRMEKELNQSRRRCEELEQLVESLKSDDQKEEFGRRA